MPWNPEDYAENSTAQLEWALSIVSRCDLASDDSVIDVGCGDGKITAEIARAVSDGQVLGVDSSEEFINYATKTYPKDAFPNLEFKQMDARRLESEEKFDLLFSNATLHWVDDHPAFLRGASAVLKPGGRLVTSCGGGRNAEEIVAAVTEVTKHDEWSPYFKDFTFPYTFHSPDDYLPWLKENSFIPVSVQLVDKDMQHEGAIGLKGWFRTTWMPFTERVPAELREDFISATADAFLEAHPLDEHGRCHVKMQRLEVEATKI